MRRPSCIHSCAVKKMTIRKKGDVILCGKEFLDYFVVQAILASNALQGKGPLSAWSGRSIS